MNIRKTSLLISSILVLSFVGIISTKLVTLYQTKTESEKNPKLIEANSLLNKATIELSLERSVMQVTLNIDSPIQSEFRQLLNQQRRLSDEGFENVKSLVATIPNSSRKDKFSSQLTTLRSEITQIRQSADRNLSRDRKDRSQDDISNLPTSMKSIILQFTSLPLLLKPEDTFLPTTVTKLELVQRNAWAVREFGGRERTHLAIAIATGRGFTDSVKAEMKGDHTRALEAMHNLKVLAESDGLTQEIKSGISQIETQYFGNYSRTRESIFNAKKNGETPPISFPAFFQESSDALNTAVELSYLAGGTMETYLVNYMKSSGAEFFIYLTALIAMITLCGFQIYYMEVRVSRRILALVQFMRRLSAGDTGFDLSKMKAKDELGDITECLEVFRQNSLEKARLENAASEIAGQFEKDVGGIVQKVEEASAKMYDMSQKLSGIISDSSSLCNSVADASKSAAMDVQTMASASEEMSSSLSNLSDSVSNAATRSMECSKSAQVSQAKLEELQAAIQEIDSVSQAINGISEQTNLLALNATIEAASAGESGKGFAVVATEVKSLANQTRNMTDEISQKINDVKETAELTIKSVNEIITEISAVDDSTNQISSAIREQTDATVEISRSASSAAGLTGDVSSNIEEVRQAADISSSSTHELNEAATAMINDSNELKSAVDEFLREIRK